jgi:hypothetical protein
MESICFVGVVMVSLSHEIVYNYSTSKDWLVKLVCESGVTGFLVVGIVPEEWLWHYMYFMSVDWLTDIVRRGNR